jgi:peroxiredoxin
MKSVLFAALAAFALIVGLTVNVFAAKDGHAGHNHAKLSIGDAAPAFTLKDQAGKDVSLSDLSGKVVVLEWFNEECPFVVKHYKQGHMNKLAASYAEKGVVWVRINSTSKSTPESNAKIAAEWKMSGPILQDSDGEVGHDYGATNTPHMYVINKEGKLVYRGAIDSDSSADTAKVDGATNYVAKALDEVLADKPVSQPETKAYGCTVKYAK